MKKAILLLFIPICLWAQNTSPIIHNELIVSLLEGYSVEEILSTPFARNSVLEFEYKTLSNRKKLYLIHDKNHSNIRPFVVEEFSKTLGVQHVQFNYKVDFRETFPDDPDFDLEWGLHRIQLPKVWDITTGGMTARGDTIVIAIIDQGIDIEHEDLKENIWQNPSETPFDGIDNDGNGYIDDRHGWNFRMDTNIFIPNNHGLGVAGIIGAVGNNSIGISGINWNVKLMLLRAGYVDEIFAAYEYVIDMRRRYNESGGTDGAFVVATNASFGIPRQPCVEHPMWNDLYNQLGEVGVLTAGATANQSYDVDEIGDLPTSCTSDFLITTLNMNEEDERHQGSAYGKKSIDMGAPGKNSYSLVINNTYRRFHGTSAAAPHIAGTIGLLYSLPCMTLAENAIRQPAETALFIKDIILKGTKPIEDIRDETLTGGMLNVYRSLEQLQDFCETTTGPLKINLLYPNPAMDWLNFEYETPDFGPYQLEIFNALGQLVYKETLRPLRFLTKKHSVHIANLPKGIYFISLKNGKNRASFKWMKI